VRAQCLPPCPPCPPWFKPLSGISAPADRERKPQGTDRARSAGRSAARG
jgi:hypothetical protein